MDQEADGFHLIHRQLLLGFRQNGISKDGWKKREFFDGDGVDVGLLVSIFGFDKFLPSANFECFVQIGRATADGFGHVGNGFEAFPSA